MTPEGKYPHHPKTPENSNGHEQIPSLPTEEILFDISNLHNRSVETALSPEQRSDLYKNMHALAERFENQDMLKAYEEGRVPTFESMELAVKNITSELEADKEDPEIAQLLKFLSQRVKEIRRWCLKYEQSILVFQRKKRNRFNVDNTDAAREFAQADIERRRIHDSLMASIRSLDEIITKLTEDVGTSQQVVRWVPGLQLPENYANENPLIFKASAATHGNRDLIRDWSIVANMEQKLAVTKTYFSEN